MNVEVYVNLLWTLNDLFSKSGITSALEVFSRKFGVKVTKIHKYLLQNWLSQQFKTNNFLKARENLSAVRFLALPLIYNSTKKKIFLSVAICPTNMFMFIINLAIIFAFSGKILCICMYWSCILYPLLFLASLI